MRSGEPITGANDPRFASTRRDPAGTLLQVRDPRFDSLRPGQIPDSCLGVKGSPVQIRPPRLVLGNTVSVIDGATNTVTAGVGVGGFPVGVAVDTATPADGSGVWAADSAGPAARPDNLHTHTSRPNNQIKCTAAVAAHVSEGSSGLALPRLSCRGGPVRML